VGCVAPGYRSQHKRTRATHAHTPAGAPPPRGKAVWSGHNLTRIKAWIIPRAAWPTRGNPQGMNGRVWVLCGAAEPRTARGQGGGSTGGGAAGRSGARLPPPATTPKPPTGDTAGGVAGRGGPLNSRGWQPKAQGGAGGAGGAHGQSRHGDGGPEHRNTTRWRSLSPNRGLPGGRARGWERGARGRGGVAHLQGQRPTRSGCSRYTGHGGRRTAATNTAPRGCGGGGRAHKIHRAAGRVGGGSRVEVGFWGPPHHTGRRGAAHQPGSAHPFLHAERRVVRATTPTPKGPTRTGGRWAGTENGADVRHPQGHERKPRRGGGGLTPHRHGGGVGGGGRECCTGVGAYLSEPRRRNKQGLDWDNPPLCAPTPPPGPPRP